MSRYRYRTLTLFGPWRDSLLKAECDAVARGQAEFAGPGARFTWKVPGEIEVDEGEEEAAAGGD